MRFSRRQFLGSSAKSALAVGAATTALVASDALKAGAGMAERSREELAENLKRLERRFDKLDRRHKQLIRIGGVALAVTTGVDLVAFL